MGDLAALDGAMLRTIGEAAEQSRWGHAEELLAVVAELLHALLLRTLLGQGVETYKLPKPLHVARPHERAAGPKTVSWGQFARQMLRGG